MKESKNSIKFRLLAFCGLNSALGKGKKQLLMSISFQWRSKLKIRLRVSTSPQPPFLIKFRNSRIFGMILPIFQGILRKRLLTKKNQIIYSFWKGKILIQGRKQKIHYGRKEKNKKRKEKVKPEAVFMYQKKEFENYLNKKIRNRRMK